MNLTVKYQTTIENTKSLKQINLGTVKISISLLLFLPLLNNTDQTLEKTEQFKEGLKNTIFFTLAEKNYILLVLGFFVCGFHVTFIGLHLPTDLIALV